MSWEDARAKARDVLAALTDEEDAALTHAAFADPDTEPLDAEKRARMRPAASAEIADIKKRLRGRPPVPSPKHLVSLRLDQDVVVHFRATGPGWQSRINAVLRGHLPQA